MESCSSIFPTQIQRIPTILVIMVKGYSCPELVFNA